MLLQTNRWQVSFGWLICGLALFTVSAANGQSKAGKDGKASELVSEALVREIYGDQQERQSLLEQALAENPQFAPARWHLGFVRYQNRWERAEDVPQHAQNDRKLMRYDQQRAEASDDVAGQLKLANWCRSQGLRQQERAHLFRVLDHNADHAQARNRLGFRRINQRWLTNEEIAEAADAVQQDRQNVEKWRDRITRLRTNLNHSNPARRKKAEQTLAEILDPTAIMAMELILSSDNAQTSRLVVETLANMVDLRAAVSLARHAVYSPWAEVRQLAANKLQERDLVEYVPAMMDTLQTQIRSGVQVTTDRRGRLIYRHILLQERQDEHQTLVRDTVYERRSLPNSVAGEALQRATDDIQVGARGRTMSVEMRNLEIEQVNQRIGEALTVATGVKLEDATPQSWWQWWNGQNDLVATGPKPTQVDYRRENVTVTDRPILTGPGQTTGPTGPTRTISMPSDCLAAGTPVWTSRGHVAVDKVQIGDLVLCQQTESGELSYQPVLRTTTRQPGRLVRIRAGEESLQCSLGHPFWVSGEGWVLARDLKPGMQLHTVSGSVQVLSVESSTIAPTYNLVVDGAHNYFVGKQGILNHDNLLRRATTACVPGLVD